MNKELLQKAIDTYGEDAQMDMCIEEMSELTKAILKLRRYQKAHEGDCTKALLDNIAEEVADVEIMLEQVKIMLECENEVNEQKKYKLIRLKARLDT